MESATNLEGSDRKIVEYAMRKVPEVEKIISDALSQSSIDTRDVKGDFCKALVELEKRVSAKYFEYDKKALAELVALWEEKNGGQLSASDGPERTRLLCNFAGIVRIFEFRAGQMRKARAGRTLEKLVEFLLKKIGIGCEAPRNEGREVLKRIDLAVPSQDIALERPDQAFFLSCKRTLRERWKQTIPERKPGWRVFLLTLDDDLPEKKADEVNELGLVAYVKDDLKESDHLKTKAWVRKLSDLPKDLGAR